MHLPDDDEASELSDSSNEQEHEPGHVHGQGQKPEHEAHQGLNGPNGTIGGIPNANTTGSRPSTADSKRTGPSQTSTIETMSDSTKSSKKAAKRSEQRHQRGIMQWKPARNATFAKDEAVFALRKVKQRFSGDLAGREPDIETETGT
jgi:hypothetical protein